MRVLPASSFKTNRKGGALNKRPLLADGMPADGTKTRQIFDMFRAKKGEPIHNQEFKDALGVTKISDKSRLFMDLSDYYGLDIRSVPDCHHKCLVGEWFGDKYVDYVAEKIKDR